MVETQPTSKPGCWDTPEALLREAKGHMEAHPSQPSPGGDEELAEELLEWEKQFIVLLCNWVNAVVADMGRLQRLQEVVGFLDRLDVRERIEQAKNLVRAALDRVADSDLPGETVAHLRQLAAELESADLRDNIYPLKLAYKAVSGIAGTAGRLHRLAAELEGAARQADIRPPSLWPAWDKAVKQAHGVVGEVVKLLSFDMEAKLSQDARRVLAIYKEYWPEPDERIVGEVVRWSPVIYESKGRPRWWWRRLYDGMRRLTEHLYEGNANPPEPTEQVEPEQPSPSPKSRPRGRVRPPTDEQKEMAHFYEFGAGSQAKIAEMMTKLRRRPIGQSVVSRAIKAVNRWRKAQDSSLREISTQRRKIVFPKDPKKLEQGPPLDGRAKRPRRDSDH